jgi:hypothetical protein
MKRILIPSLILSLALPVVASAAIFVAPGGTQTANVTWPDLDGSSNTATGTIDPAPTRAMSIVANGATLGTGAGKIVSFETDFLTIGESFTVAADNFFGVGSTTDASLLPLLAIDLAGGGPLPPTSISATVGFWQKSSNSAVFQSFNVDVADIDQLVVSASGNDIVQSVEIEVVESSYRIETAKLWVDANAIVESQPPTDPPNGEIPEPSTLACWLLLGLSSIGAISRRRRKAA